MDQNPSMLQVTFQISQEQSEREEPKSLFRSPWLKILLILFVSSLIATVIGLGFHSHWKKNQAPAPCLSPACLRISEHFSAVMDPFSRPCDYYLFTCGTLSLSKGRQRGKAISPNITTGQDKRRWTGRGGGGRTNREPAAEREQENEEEPDRLPDRHTALLQTIKEILESPVTGLSVNSVEEKAQRFYNTCTYFKTSNTINSDRFLTLVQQIGGWPVSGRRNKTDFNSTLTLLMAQYNTFPFFNVYVGPDHREDVINESQHYIQIDQPDFQFPIDWSNPKQTPKITMQVLRPFLSSCRKLLALSNFPLTETVEHCSLYVSLSSTLVTSTSPLQYRLSQKLLYHRITIQMLQLLAPAIDWLPCLQAIFYPLPVSQSDFVLVHNLPYIIHMSQTVSDWKHKYEKMGRYPLHTYMILTLLQTLIPALDSRFTKIINEFSTAIGSTEKVVPPWKHCVLQTVKGFDMLLSHMIKEHYAHEEAEELIHDIYSTFQTKVLNLSWRDKERHDFVLNKVKSLSPRLSTDTKVLNQLNLNNHYAEVIISEKDYFSNYLQMLFLQQRRKSNLLSHTALHDVLFTSPFVSGNDIIVPAGLFVPPLFNPSYPRAINYGMIGSFIAKDLLHLLLPSILSQSESAMLESECVWSHYLRGRESPDGAKTSFLSQSQQQEVWVQYSALQIALQAYHKSLRRHSSDISVSGLSHVHLFLSSFIQASCVSEPYRAFMPFEPSFLVTVLCKNSDLCPKPLICEDESQRRLPERC